MGKNLRAAWRLLKKVAWPGILYAVCGFLVAALLYGKPWHQVPAWGDIPTWLAALAATVAGGVALSQLRSQAEVIRRDAEDRRRDQAASVFIEPIGSAGRAPQPFANNASRYPIFDAQLWYLPDGEADDLRDPETLGMVMPGVKEGIQRQLPLAEILEKVILTFRDASGASWIRMPGGMLLEQAKPTVRDSVISAIASARRTSGSS